MTTLQMLSVFTDEDEATGDAAVRLATLLAWLVKIHQGRGLILLARPDVNGTAEVGGTTRFIDRRDVPGC